MQTPFFYRVCCAMLAAGVTTTALAQDAGDPPTFTDMAEPGPDSTETAAVDVDDSSPSNGDSDAITMRQSEFNLLRQELNQEASLTEIQARIAEAQARIAEAARRGEARSQSQEDADPLENIDAAALREKLGLPAEGTLVVAPEPGSGPDPAQEAEPAPPPEPIDPAMVAIPTLRSITGNTATFNVMGNIIEARPGQSINDRYRLSAINSRGVTIEDEKGRAQQLMIQWADQDAEASAENRGRRVVGG